MKVLLIMPPSGEKVIMNGDNVFLHEPLALEYVGAGIKGSHDVKLLDMRIDKNLEKALKDFTPDIAGTTGYTIHVKTCKKILKRVKDINPRIVTVIGGHHATINPESFCENYIDIIVMGEGVYTFKEIVERLERKEDLKTIAGIAVSENGKLCLASVRNYTGLDDIPFPDRTLTSEYRERYFTSGMRPVASIRSSVGCAFRCSFCALWRITDKKYITRDPEHIVEELSSIKEPYVLFTDDETFLNIKRMDLLADYIKEAGIRKKYQMSVRADTIVRNSGLFEKWGKIGLSRVRVGFESYLDEDLRSFNKKTSTSVNEEALHILQKYNIACVSQFIVNPDYDRERFKQLGQYVKKHKIRIPSFSVLTPLPGSVFYEEVKDKMIAKDYDLYDFKHTLLPTALSLKDFYCEFARLHMRMLPFWRYIPYRYFFPLTQFMPTFGMGYQILSTMKNAYKDHKENDSNLSLH